MQYRKLTELKKLDNNPRTIKKQDMDKLVESIKNNQDYFEARPLILSNRTGELVILGGNQRYEAAKKLGLKQVPTHLIEGLTEEREREIVIRDNVANGEWDWDVLANEWDAEELDEWGLDTPDDWEEETEVEEDEAPEVDESEPPKSKLGEVYQLGRHRVMCGDSTDGENYSVLMDGVQADLLHTDPPYGIDYEGGSKKRDKIANDAIPVLEFYTEVLSLCRGYCKAGAGAYIWHASSETHNAINAFINAGWQYKQYIIWNKNNSTFGRQDYHWKHEPAIYGWGQGSHSWHGDRKQTTVWDIDRPSTAEEHPTMKPIALCAKAINNSTKQEDIVLDVFLGSGSTLIACEQTDRTCYGMELDPKYTDVIRKRWT